MVTFQTLTRLLLLIIFQLSRELRTPRCATHLVSIRVIRNLIYRIESTTLNLLKVLCSTLFLLNREGSKIILRSGVVCITKVRIWVCCLNIRCRGSRCYRLRLLCFRDIRCRRWSLGLRLRTVGFVFILSTHDLLVVVTHDLQIEVTFYCQHIVTLDSLTLISTNDLGIVVRDISVLVTKTILEVSLTTRTRLNCLFLARCCVKDLFSTIQEGLHLHHVGIDISKHLVDVTATQTTAILRVARAQQRSIVSALDSFFNVCTCRGAYQREPRFRFRSFNLPPTIFLEEETQDCQDECNQWSPVKISEVKFHDHGDSFTQSWCCLTHCTSSINSRDDVASDTWHTIHRRLDTLQDTVGDTFNCFTDCRLDHTGDLIYR